MKESNAEARLPPQARRLLRVAKALDDAKMLKVDRISGTAPFERRGSDLAAAGAWSRAISTANTVCDERIKEALAAFESIEAAAYADRKETIEAVRAIYRSGKW